MKAETERNITFDILKGLAICLVVLSHCIQYINVDGWKDVYILKISHMFLMPLFIYISGFFFLPSANKAPAIPYITKKSRKILLPSISLGIIYTVLLTVLPFFKNHTFSIVLPDNVEYFGLWYLNVLFIMLVISKILTIGRFYMYFYILAALLFLILPDDVFMVKQLRFLYPYFIFGVLMKNIHRYDFPFWLSMISLLLLFAGGFYWKLDYTLYFLRSTDANYWIITLFRYGAGMVGIIATFGISRLIEQSTRLTIILSAIGKMTLPIYLIQDILFKIISKLRFNSDNMILILLLFMAIIFISIILYRFLRKNKFVAFCLFGESQRKAV